MMSRHDALRAWFVDLIGRLSPADLDEVYDNLLLYMDFYAKKECDE